MHAFDVPYSGGKPLDIDVIDPSIRGRWEGGNTNICPGATSHRSATPLFEVPSQLEGHRRKVEGHTQKFFAGASRRPIVPTHFQIRSGAPERWHTSTTFRRPKWRRSSDIEREEHEDDSKKKTLPWAWDKPLSVPSYIHKFVFQNSLTQKRWSPYLFPSHFRGIVCVIGTPPRER